MFISISCDSKPGADPPETIHEEGSDDTEGPDFQERVAEAASQVAPFLPATSSVPKTSDVRQVPDENSSPHFDAVLEHLEIGGDTFVYHDFEEEISEISGSITELLDLSSVSEETLAGAGERPQPEEIVTALFDATGISSVAAVGSETENFGRFPKAKSES